MVLSFPLFLFFFWCALNVNFHAHNIIATLSIIPYPTKSRHCVEKSQKKQIGKNRNERIDDILDTPVYIRVNLMPCPPGFLLSTSYPPKCDCNNQLHPLPDVACNIQYSTLQRRGLVWIGPLTDDNDTITDVVSFENCPLNYCKDETVSFQLNASSAQCNYNHSGRVCGGCQPGLSLALGTACTVPGADPGFFEGGGWISGVVT